MPSLFGEPQLYFRSRALVVCLDYYIWILDTWFDLFRFTFESSSGLIDISSLYLDDEFGDGDSITTPTDSQRQEALDAHDRALDAHDLATAHARSIRVVQNANGELISFNNNQKEQIFLQKNASVALLTRDLLETPQSGMSLTSFHLPAHIEYITDKAGVEENAFSAAFQTVMPLPWWRQYSKTAGYAIDFLAGRFRIPAVATATNFTWSDLLSPSSVQSPELRATAIRPSRPHHIVIEFLRNLRLAFVVAHGLQGDELRLTAITDELGRTERQGLGIYPPMFHLDNVKRGG